MRDCPEPRREGKGVSSGTEDAVQLGALNYKGNGKGKGSKGYGKTYNPQHYATPKGKGKGKGFQGMCWLCYLVGHTMAECNGKRQGRQDRKMRIPLG